MRAEEAIHADISEGDRAKAALEILAPYLQKVGASIRSRWENSSPEDTAQREMLYWEHRALKSWVARVNDAVKTGDLARLELK